MSVGTFHGLLRSYIETVASSRIEVCFVAKETLRDGQHNQAGGFEGIWSVSESNADRLVRNGGLLMASCKGYVAPGCVRKVIGWEADQGSSRRYFHTESASAEVQNLIGGGIWIDVPGGSESGILVDET